MSTNKKPGLSGIILNISSKDLKTLLNKDPKNFAVIYNACSGPIILLVTKLLGKEAAEDIFHDVMVILWNNSHKIKSLEHMQGFLFETCKNKCIDILRRNAKLNMRKIEIHRKVKDFEQNMHNYIIECNVLSLLSIQSLLNEEEIKVLNYCDEGYKLKEISLMMDKSVSTISKIKATAKQKIQNYYRNDKDA